MANNPLVQIVKLALWKTSPRLYRQIVSPYHGQRFAISTYHGKSYDNLTPCNPDLTPAITNLSITDRPAVFVADPFMLWVDNLWYMFFEILDGISWHGRIGLATSTDGKQWQFQCTVLNEPFHLAYPYVFGVGDEFYMIPDTPDQGIRLYQAKGFPKGWEFVSQIAPQNCFSDSSIFHHDDSWWLLSTWAPDKTTPQTLRLFYADDLCGDWTEHPVSPVVSADQQIVRSCGRIKVLADGRILRFAQDCSNVYGESVRLVEITKLNRREYQETKFDPPILTPGVDDWNSGGMHHIDAHDVDTGLLCCVDGWKTV